MSLTAKSPIPESLPNDELLRITDVVKIIKVCRRQIERMRKQGLFPLPVYPPGCTRSPRFKRSEISEWMSSLKSR